MFNFSEIGIDLGAYEIKIAEAGKVKLDGGQNSDLNHLKSYKSYTADCPAYSDEYFKLLKSSIRDYSKTFKKKRLSLNISLPINEYTNLLFLTVPSVSKKDLEVGINFEAEQALALEGVQNSQFTWKIIDEYPELNQYEVLLAVINEKIVGALSGFKTIKWKVNRVMLQPILLERFSKGNDIIVDFGYSSTRVYMYKGGKLVEAESVSIAGQSIKEKIDNYLKDNDIEEVNEDGSKLNAEDIIEDIYIPNELIKNIDKFTNENTEYDVLNLEGAEDNEEISDYLLYSKKTEIIDKVSEVIQPKINRLIDEIKRIIRAFELKNGLDADNVYYVGEFSNLNYFAEKLESQLDLPTKSLNIVNKDIEGLKYELASLAMLDAKLKDDTNFTGSVKANVDYKSIIVAILAISLSVGAAFFMLNNKYLDVINEQQVQEREQLATIEELENEASIEQEDINRSEAFINKIAKLKSQKKWLSDILYIIPDITPKNVVLKELNIVSGRVEILGYGADYSSIGFLSAELEKIGNVNIESIEDPVNLDNYIDSAKEEGIVYSVVNSNFDISNKFIMTKEFNMTLDYNNDLLHHDSGTANLGQEPPVSNPTEDIGQPDQAPTNISKAFIGNANTMKFHNTGCRHLPNEANRVNLNAESVTSGGYEPCGHCKPKLASK